MLSAPALVMACVCKGGMVASYVDVKMCLLTPLIETHPWFNVLTDSITTTRPSGTRHTAINYRVCCFYVETNVSPEVLMSLVSSCLSVLNNLYLKNNKLSYTVYHTLI